MQLKLVLFSAACLSFFMAPAGGTNLLAAAAAAKGVVISGLAGASGAQSVVIHTNPPPHIPQVIFEHNPATLVPVATIPSYSITDKISKIWGGISDSISTKIQAVGEFFRGPPQIVLVNTPHKPTTTKKPHPPVVVEIVGVPHHPYPVPVPVVVGDCGNKIRCIY